MLKLGVSADEMKHIKETRSSIVRDSASKTRQKKLKQKQGVHRVSLNMDNPCSRPE